MPRDYHAMLTISIPLSFLWTFLFAAYLWRYRRQGLWAILGAPSSILVADLAAHQWSAVLLLHA